MFNFVTESNAIEGILRPPTKEEVAAHRVFVAQPETPTCAALEELVAVIQPGAALRTEPGMDVRVGNFLPPSGGPWVKPTLEGLLREISCGRLDPWEAHVRYENLHPFTDGNGRSGRALWLWQMHNKAPLGFLHHFYYQTLQHVVR